MRLLRLAPALLLLATACVPGRPSLKPGSDMALPRSPGLTVTTNAGHTCGSASVGGIGLAIGNVNHCTLLSPDSARHPAAKPPGILPVP